MNSCILIGKLNVNLYKVLYSYVLMMYLFCRKKLDFIVHCDNLRGRLLEFLPFRRMQNGN